MEEDIRGKFITRDKGNGIKYKIYVPENVNANTPVFTYALGSGDPGIEKCLLEQGSDSIFIVTVVDYNADIANITMNIVDEVKSEFGITSTIVTPSGFSLGGPVGYKTAAENIRRNPGCDPQTVFLVDAYGTYFYNPKLHLNDKETINLFKENNTVFFALDHPLKTTDINTLYAQAGLNIIQVKCVGQGHMDINGSFFNEKMYDYMAGEALPKDGYIYSKYNIETGEWEEIPYEEIATRDDLNWYFGIDTLTSNIERLSNLQDIIVKSDDKILENYINNIRRTLKNTNFLSANFGKTSYASTTQVPNAIPDLITEYFTMTSSLLNSIASKTTKIASIAGEIEKLDNEMSKEAELLNENIIQKIPLQTETTLLTNTAVNNSNTIINNKNDNVKIENININQTVSKEETPSNNKYQSPSKNKEVNTPYQEKTPIEEQFIEYDKLYSTNDKVVYNYNDEYKIVIHHENGKVIGIEHYYDYQTAEKAMQAVEELNINYKNIDNFDRIIQKDRYVKVLFKEEMYNNISLNKFKEMYRELNQVLEQL